MAAGLLATRVEVEVFHQARSMEEEVVGVEEELGGLLAVAEVVQQEELVVSQQEVVEVVQQEEL